MYLYGATNSLPKRSQDLEARVITQEITNASIARITMKDLTSSKLQIKASKAADAAHFVEMRKFRQQIVSLPEAVKEQARISYLTVQEIRRKDLQEFQCVMISRLEKILRHAVTANGLDFRKFKIGGFKGGTYEKFFKVEPARYMTKPQFATALRRTFGDEVMNNEASTNKLFDSFDIERLDQLDWRAFLFLLTIMMQPDLPCETHLRWAFALYSSVGSLDLECRTRLPLGVIKAMLTAPVMLSLRSDVLLCLNQAWDELTLNDMDACQVASKASFDPDKSLLSFKMFMKLIKETSFSLMLQPARPFGKTDPKPWTYVLEEQFFHPHILHSMKALRRLARNEDECRDFIARQLVRDKGRALDHWKTLVSNRNKIRFMIVSCAVQWRNDRCSICFDRWRELTMQMCASETVQRVARGFVARRRRDFMKGLQVRVRKVQANTRKLRRRSSYMKTMTRRRWAAVTIQRRVRGRQARRRVQSIVEALYDTGKRQLAQARERWILGRKMKAAFSIQMRFRRFLMAKRMLKKMQEREHQDKLAAEMDAAVEKNRVATEVFRQELEHWFIARKAEYDRDRFLEAHTSEQRAKIMKFRNSNAQAARLEKQRYRDEQLEKAQELRIEQWLMTWDIKKAERTKARGQTCHRALHNPETLEEVALRKDLQQRIKKHIKNVLRRADKQKIPMEIPEATELATREIIDAEIEAERQRVEEERLAEATRLQALEEEKAENAKKQEAAANKRKRRWAANVIQGRARCFLSRKILRKKAYERYKKYFDTRTLNYYYVNTRNDKTLWDKPKSLGSYDIDCDEGWLVMHDSEGDLYYYCPRTWDMQWTQPVNTFQCEVCDKDFCVARLNSNLKSYCEKCFNTEVASILAVGDVEAINITFKPFHGNREGSRNTRFSSIKDTNWYLHIMALDPRLREAEAGRLEADTALKPKEEIVIKCSRCNETLATKQCDMCVNYFCDSCYDNKHKKAPWDAHTFTALTEEKLAEIREQMAPKKKGSMARSSVARNSMARGKRASVSRSKSPKSRQSSAQNKRSSVSAGAIVGGAGDDLEAAIAAARSAQEADEQEQQANYDSTDGENSSPDKKKKKKKKKKRVKIQEASDDQAAAAAAADPPIGPPPVVTGQHHPVIGPPPLRRKDSNSKGGTVAPAVAAPTQLPKIWKSVDA